MALPATDDFNRANQAGFGSASWTIQRNGSPGFQIVSNTLETAFGANSEAFWNADTFANDQYAQCTSPAGGGSAGPAVRASGTGSSTNTYGLIGSILRKVVGGSVTFLKAVTAPAAGQTMKLTATGTSLQCYLNGAANGTALTDASLSSGSAGVIGAAATVIDNWEGGNIGGGGAATPVAVFYMHRVSQGMS